MAAPVRHLAQRPSVEAEIDVIDFVGLRRYFALISLALLVPCLIALALWQLEPGIDFEGGLELEVRFLSATSDDAIESALIAGDLERVTVVDQQDATFLVGFAVPEGFSTNDATAVARTQLTDGLGEFVVQDSTFTGDLVSWEVWFPANVSQNDVRDTLQSLDLGDARIQATGDSSFKVRAQEPDGVALATLQSDVEAAFVSDIGPIFVLQSALVSGILSSEIAKDASIALVIAAVAILIYISLAFRRLPNPALYGAAAIVALLHDITIVVGVFSILGQVADLEVNAMFVTALLAIIGYSVNDTIVVFDRIRENVLNSPGASMRQTVNAAITQSLGRSLNTSITLIVALLALILIGGVTVRPFVLVLLVGAVAGTYSSIAVASQIIVLWEERSFHRLIRRRRSAPSAARARLAP